MFTDKDKPELYELLKMNRSKLGRAPAQEKDDQAVSAPVTTPSDSDPIPYTTPISSTARPYPKLRMPFPMLKPKEPTGVFQKPKAVRPKTRGEATPLNYPKIIVIGGIIIAVIIILYLLLSLPQATPSSPGRTTTTSAQTATEGSPVGKTPTTPPAATGRKWSLRLIYYKNNSEGQNLVQNRLRFLNEKGVSDVFTKNETLNGSPCTVIYKGRYASSEEAKKDIPGLKKLHYAFKNADAVEVK